MKVSPSLYSSSLTIEETVSQIRNTLSEYIHIDIKNSKNLDKVEKDVKIIRDNCDLLVDVHLIDKKPLEKLDQIKRISPDLIAIQYEDLENPSDFYEIRKAIPRTGIAITKSTDFEKIRDIIDSSSYVLLMTTTPGESGGSFSQENLDWIKKFKVCFPEKKVHVDGGVDDIVSDKIRDLNIDCIVSGSYLMRASSMIASVLKLKGIKSSSKLEETMISLDHIPKISSKESILEALLAIEKSQRGFCFVESEDSWGIVTDGDVRRFLISNKMKVNLKEDISLLTNFSPFSIDSKKTIENLLCKLAKEKFDKKLKFIVLTCYNSPVGIQTVERIMSGDK